MKSTLLAGLAALAFAGLAPHPAAAAIVTRHMLISACTAHNANGVNNCAGYIAGIADTVDSTAQHVCIPPGLKIGLLRQGVSNWLQSHTTTDGPAAPAVIDALRTLYRCIG